MPGQDDRELKHRDEFEKEEEEDFEDAEDQFEDLIGAGIDNSSMSDTANVVRAQRAANDIDQDQVQEMFEVMSDWDLEDLLPAPGSGISTEYGTADGDENPSGPPAPPPLAAPDAEDDEGLPSSAAFSTDSWAPDRRDLDAPAATEPDMEKSDQSDWLSDDDSLAD